MYKTNIKLICFAKKLVCKYVFKMLLTDQHKYLIQAKNWGNNNGQQLLSNDLQNMILCWKINLSKTKYVEDYKGVPRGFGECNNFCFIQYYGIFFKLLIDLSRILQSKYLY